LEYLPYYPGPPLDAFVENLWSLSDAPPHGRERILPSGTLELVINLHEDEFRIYEDLDSGLPKRYRGAMVSGAYSGPFVIDTREHASILGVHFAPGGAAAFFDAPPGHLADAHVELETLWPGHASELRGRLCEARSPADRLRILEQALIARLRRFSKHRSVIRRALEQIARPGVTIAEVAIHVGLSHRRLIEVFTAEVGAPPKLFGRLMRFQRAVAAMQKVASVDWAQLAVGCGYYDQSHMIKDFAEFSGFSPVALLRHRRDSVKVNHVALPDRAGSNFSNTAPGSVATFHERGGANEIAPEQDP
jgi:AraC-like DNA-binding protein